MDVDLGGIVVSRLDLDSMGGSNTPFILNRHISEGVSIEDHKSDERESLSNDYFIERSESFSLSNIFSLLSLISNCLLFCADDVSN